MNNFSFFKTNLLGNFTDFLEPFSPDKVLSHVMDVCILFDLLIPHIACRLYVYISAFYWYIKKVK